MTPTLRVQLLPQTPGPQVSSAWNTQTRLKHPKQSSGSWPLWNLVDKVHRTHPGHRSRGEARRWTLLDLDTTPAGVSQTCNADCPSHDTTKPNVSHFNTLISKMLPTSSWLHTAQLHKHLGTYKVVRHRVRSAFTDRKLLQTSAYTFSYTLLLHLVRYTLQPMYSHK